MSTLILCFLSLFCFTFGAKSNPNSIIVPCKINDEDCMTKSANIALRLIGQGVPSLNIPPIDPIKTDVFQIKLPSIQLTYKNLTQNRFSKCEVQNVKLNMDTLNLKFDLKCPSIELIGHYSVTGTLLSLPLEGQGPCRTITGTYLINVDAELERVTGNDGRTYLAIKKSKQVADSLEPVKFQYDNLFNGQKELSDAAHAFAHKHYKEVMAHLQGSILDGNFKYFSKCVNALLKTTPIDNLFIN
ncbi:PREDICTED: uncharacterized protein LOC106105677 [Papilio polytes]|uniref:uncharacterized protein LOC106105677 n=1 Tax=Papilio polytes TaxID=76194 RepID=UPI0006768E96|nr:PREDICTED: uncharacterized protein LOC106105677 [Papilio polytes]